MYIILIQFGQIIGLIPVFLVQGVTQSDQYTDKLVRTNAMYLMAQLMALAGCATG